MPNMTIVGAGSSALRIFWFDNICEIRFSSMIVKCNVELTHVLKTIINYDFLEGMTELKKITGMECTEYNRQIIRDTLSSLEQIGVQKNVWRTDWINFAYEGQGDFSYDK